MFVMTTGFLAICGALVNFYLIKNLNALHNAFGFFWAARTVGEAGSDLVYAVYTGPITLVYVVPTDGEGSVDRGIWTICLQKCGRTGERHMTGKVHVAPRATMDTVPLKFVDSTVELFSKKTLDVLAPEVRHSLWKDVVDLHHRNRVYYNLLFRDRIHSAQYLFTNGNDDNVSVQTIRKNRRFARIVNIRDLSWIPSPIAFWEDVKPHGGEEKLLKSIAPLICQVDTILRSGFSSDITKMLLTPLFKRVYLQQVMLYYCGQIALDFLEDQIDNSPFLSHVQIEGENWPQSSLELLTNFCLKGKPGNHVKACMTCTDVTIDSSCMKSLLDHWKQRGNLNFRLQHGGLNINEETLQALLNQGQAIESFPMSESVFKHKSQKSIAIISPLLCFMQCYICECDRFGQCLLKKDYPQFHEF
uniref:7TM_GPCR_Srx domain-containing protein n=1 Tax=Steinernema glaseri TaxID=37863 RepID=A0A1I7Y3W0_9BILA